MPARERTKGNTAERAVARYLRDNGWPMAVTSRAASNGLQRGEDIIGVPGASIEVKNRYNLNIGASLLQAKIQGPGKLPWLIAKPYGIGLDRVGEWFSITYVADQIPLLPREGDL